MWTLSSGSSETRKKRELPTQITQRLKRDNMLWAHKGWKAIAMGRWAICVVAAQPHLGEQVVEESAPSLRSGSAFLAELPKLDDRRCPASQKRRKL